MTCLTVTPETAAEAVAERAELIVSHHPILFKGAKTIRADRPETGFLWTLARAGVAVYSPHTAFDNTAGGINDVLAERLNLQNLGPLRPGPARQEFKVVVFAPESDREAVLAAAFGAGAGRIGAYEECSFSTAGHGTFFGTESTNPTLGRRGRRETVDEWKVEVVCPARRLDAVLAAIRSAHSYEEPAIDVFPLHGPPEGPGAGRVGDLPEPTTLAALAACVARLLESPGTTYAGRPDRAVRRVAICCGAGGDFLADAARAQADALLTGEARFHTGLEAEARGVGLITAGHHATERPGVEVLAARLAEAFPDLRVWASRSERDPWRSPPVDRPSPLSEEMT
jgi:dinuclear metal center YbgI/SA1388 family protein